MRHIFTRIVALRNAAFFGPALQLAASRAAILVLSFVGSVALTRSIGPDGRGLIAWFVATASIAMMFAQAGVEVLNRRYTAEDPKLAGGLLMLSLKACALGTLVTTPFVIWAAVHAGFAQTHLPFVLMSPLLIFFMAVAPCLNSIQLGLNHVKPYTWSVVSQKIGNLILVLLLVVTGVVSPLTGMVALVASYALQVGWTLWMLRAPLAARLPGALAFAMGKKSFMFYTYVRNILLMSSAAIVPLLLGSRHSLASAGLFAACMILVDAITKTFGMVTLYALPRLAGTRNAAARNALKSKVLMVSLLGMGAIAAVWALAAGWAIPFILGHDFEPAVVTFRILCLYMVCLAMADAYQTLVMAATEKGWITLPPLIQLLVVSSVAWVAIPPFGANGGAIALLAGAVASVAVSWGASHIVHGRVKAPLGPEPLEN